MTESRSSPEEFYGAAHARVNQLKSVGAGLLYGVVALVMGFVNKGILQLWPYSNTLLTLQMAATVALIYLGKFVNVFTIQPLNLTAARNLMPVVFFYNANVAFALAGLQALNIPVFNALKRLTPVLIVAAKYFIGDAIPSRHVLFSIFLIVAGCIIASLGDLSFDLLGYSMALASCVLQTTYLIFVEKSGSEKGYTSHELLLYNAGLSMPVLSVIILATGEASEALTAFNARMASNKVFLLLLIFSLFMGSLLNYTLFLCTLWNSALTTTVVGAMKALFSSILGFFLLGGVEATPLNVTGIAMNTLGGMWYAYSKYQQKKKTLMPRKSSDLFTAQEGQPLLPVTTAQSSR
ncbi:hypothetical protein R1sor_007322 [Riccia sorocarpa]|uniref:Sugar phosphate transporter domain-containing protein n=1 Tax=Riccia sorocarpa TaxID=122646 RepID=A0ABD3HUA0_9MARC